MNQKLKTMIILLWIIAFYAIHYYFEIKKYIGLASEYLPFM